MNKYLVKLASLKSQEQTANKNLMIGAATGVLGGVAGPMLGLIGGEKLSRALNLSDKAARRTILGGGVIGMGAGVVGSAHVANKLTQKKK